MFLPWLVLMILLTLNDLSFPVNGLFQNNSYNFDESEVFNSTTMQLRSQDTKHFERWSQRLDDYSFLFDPPEISGLYIDSQLLVVINCSMIKSNLTHGKEPNETDRNVVFRISIESSNERVAIPIDKTANSIKDTNPNKTGHDLQVLMDHSMESKFYIHAVHLGYATLIIHILGPSDEAKTFDKYPDPTLSERTFTYQVTVVRKTRMVDFIYKWSIATIALVFSFSMGCASDLSSLRSHLKHPKSMVMGLVCQLGILPIVALVITFTFQLPREQGLGLFITACLPGGGAGHILVSIIRGDRSLSVSINFFNTLMATGLAPLWILMIGRLLGLHESPFYLALQFLVWLGLSCVLYLLGVFLRHLRVRIAEGFLNWIIKPFLLLFLILFITLGMYINLYMLTAASMKTFLTAGLVPAFGYVFGITTAHMFKQEKVFTKTIATETAICNDLLAIAMIRFSFSQPDADLMSMMAVWVLYMTPLPFIIHSIIKQTRRCVLKKCKKHREKQYNNFSIVSSLLNMTNVTNLSSSTSPKLNSPSDDNTVLIDEKITVV